MFGWSRGVVALADGLVQAGWGGNGSGFAAVKWFGVCAGGDQEERKKIGREKAQKAQEFGRGFLRG